MAKKVFPILLLVVLLALAVPAGKALAIEAITIYPTSGQVGSTVSVYGTGYTAGGAYYVYFATALQKSGVVAAGSTTINESFTVPRVAGGTVIVTVQTVGGSATASFLVTPRSALSATTATCGQQITVNGDGFGAVRTVGITLGTASLASATTDSSGVFSAVVTVPEHAGGSYPVTSLDSGGSSHATNLLIAASVTISAPSGVIGTEVRVDGKGFSATKTISMQYNAQPLPTIPSAVSSNAVGSFSAAFKAPSGSGGSHQLAVTDGTNEVKVDFAITATFSISPTEARVGEEVRASGAGFVADQTVDIYLDDTHVTSVSASSAGKFNVNFPVPQVEAGTHEIRATGGSSDVSAELKVSVNSALSKASGSSGTSVTFSGAGLSGTVSIKFDGTEIASTVSGSDGTFSATFSIPTTTVGQHLVTATDGVNSITEIFTVIADAVLDQSTGPVGIKVTVTGVGFANTVAVKFDGVEVGLADADASGAFAVTFTVPASKAGVHTIVATDGSAVIEKTFRIEANPPSLPELLLPSPGAKVGALPQFDWTDSTDPSGVSYVLQIARDSTFTAGSVIVEKANLAASGYTLSSFEKLTPTSKGSPYYWRVKAIDGASNETAWSTAGSFTVSSFISGLPWWAIVVLAVIGALAFLFLGIWIGRRSAYYY